MYFSDVEYGSIDLEKLSKEIKNVYQENNLMKKVLQLHQIQNLHHGLIMIGPSTVNGLNGQQSTYYWNWTHTVAEIDIVIPTVDTFRRSFIFLVIRT